MRFQQGGVGVEKKGSFREHEFGIGDPKLIIKLLRDKLYSDKLKVAIQEYISNARDANRVAGKPDHDIIITMPTTTEPMFSVRDHGHGLTEYQILNVFILFGVSTKQGSDETIGGFGIGAKSAWAYTDSFLVKSFVAGQVSTYLCHIGESETGTLTHLTTEPTDAPSGVEVSFNIKSNDISEAVDNIRWLTRFWPVRPQFRNATGNAPFIFDYIDVKVMMGLSLPECLKVYRSDYSKQYAPLLSVDGVPYEIPQGSDLRTVVDGILSKNIPHSVSYYYAVKTGEIDISATREAIEINGKFKAWEEKILNEIYTETLRWQHEWYTTANARTYLRDYSARVGIIRYPDSFNPAKELWKEIYEQQYATQVEFLKQALEVRQKCDKPDPYFTKVTYFNIQSILNNQSLQHNSQLFSVKFLTPEVFVYHCQKGDIKLFMECHFYRRDYARFEVKKKWFNYRSFSESGLDLVSAISRTLKEEDRNPEGHGKFAFMGSDDCIDTVRRKQRLINKSVEYMFRDQTSIPAFFPFRVKPLAECLEKPAPRIHYERTPRVVKETGSVTRLTWTQSDFKAQTPQEADSLHYGKGNRIIYIDYTETIWDVKTTLKGLALDRLLANRHLLVKFSKKAFSYAQEHHGDKVSLIPMQEWVKLCSTEPMTDKELEYLAAHRIKSQIKRPSMVVANKWPDDYKSWVDTFHQYIQGDSYEHLLSKFKRQNIKKSKLYRERIELEKKYRNLSLIEFIVSETTKGRTTRNNIFDKKELEALWSDRSLRLANGKK